MNPPSRPPVPRSAAGGAGAGEWDALPPLSQILAHYRRHGTLAASLAREAAPPTVDQPILGLETRELDAAAFERFFSRR